MTTHQTTGSITLDTEALADAVAGRVRELLGVPEPINQEEAAAALTEATRIGNQYGASFGRDVLEHLHVAGYRLVRARSQEQRAADWFAPGRTD